MGLLDKLWDDTLAGPQPDTGLGRLRKYSSFSFRSIANKGEPEGDIPRSYSENMTEESIQAQPRVTRSITIVKPPGYQINTGSPPISPAGSTPPVSPFSEERHRMQFMRRRAEMLEPGAALLLTMCEI